MTKRVDTQHGPDRLYKSQGVPTPAAAETAAGVVDPPVYDETLTYYSFVRTGEGYVAPLRFKKEDKDFLNLAEGDAQTVLEQVKQLVSAGYLGVEYDKKTHQMLFMEKDSSL